MLPRLALAEIIPEFEGKRVLVVYAGMASRWIHARCVWWFRVTAAAVATWRG